MNNKKRKELVLILVLMEYILLQFWNRQNQRNSNRLNPCFNGIYSFTSRTICFERFGNRVLILVLMEYILLLVTTMTKKQSTGGLNPCFNGIYSFTKQSNTLKFPIKSLNPCFNGIYSFTEQ